MATPSNLWLCNPETTLQLTVIAFTINLNSTNGNFIVFFSLPIAEPNCNMNHWKAQWYSTVMMIRWATRSAAHCTPHRSCSARSQRTKESQRTCGRWVWYCTPCWWGNIRSTRRQTVTWSRWSDTVLFRYLCRYPSRCAGWFLRYCVRITRSEWPRRTYS